MVAAGKAASAPAGKAKFFQAVQKQGCRVAGSSRGAQEAGGGWRGMGSLPAAHRISRPAQEVEPQGANRRWSWLRATALPASRRRSDDLAHKKPEENESLSAGFWPLLFLFPFPVKGEGSVG